MKPYLIFDIETDSPKPEEANLKWFGAYSYIDKKYYLLDYTHKDEILNLIKRHTHLIGFNNNNFDIPITKKFLGEDAFKYKIILDLWECLAPKGNNGFGSYNKGRLLQMGITDLPNYKLKTICDFLKLDEFSKGDIDYNIFKKNYWTKAEVAEIKKYLKQDTARLI